MAPNQLLRGLRPRIDAKLIEGANTLLGSIEESHDCG